MVTALVGLYSLAPARCPGCGKADEGSRMLRCSHSACVLLDPPR
jgi:hypothetical protein